MRLKPFTVSLSAVLTVVALTMSVSTTTIAADDDALPAVVRFGEHIRPIFTKHCTACHGGVKQAGDISFVYRNKVLPPDGWIVEPGSPGESVLIERVTSDDPEVVMPPPEHGGRLSPFEVELLKKWIQQGAQWDEHWAYVAPQQPPVPEVRRTGWPREKFDRFVLARLEREGIAPASEETPERWLRRVSLDLTGLPPSVEEVESFLQDLARAPAVDSPSASQTKKAVPESESAREQAYVRVVDRLLKSPHFGERWATVWLDQVRYADSKGLGLDGRRNIWKYRDWVISAFNRDMPWDEFTVRQIAGDLLPGASIENRLATAAHRLTQSNEEGGTDDEEFRVAAVLDRVNTTWQAWQGVTFGCVQCHNHPYAPFEHDEYYRFAAFFNNTADCDLNEEWPVLQVPLQTSDYDRAAELDQQISELQRTIWQKEYSVLKNGDTWRPLNGLHAQSSNATRLRVESVNGHDEFFTEGTVSRNTDITLEAPLSDGSTPLIDTLTAIRLTVKPHDVERAVADSEWGFVVSHFTAQMIMPGEDQPRELQIADVLIDEPEPFFDPRESLNPKSSRGFAAYSRIHYPRQAAFVLQEPVKVERGARLRVTLKHRVYLLAAFSLISKRGHLDVSDSGVFAQLSADAQLTEQRKRLQQVQAERSKIASTSVPILRERPQHLARPTHVFVRGLFLTKAERVEPGVPASLPPLPDSRPADRRALAQWLVSPKNPLTARVAVNRFWARLFGTGLVATEEDFGASGEPPSHPALLDFLATRFQTEHQWSTKKLLRELVLSSTYRQSSRVREDLLERDPSNRLLARGPRHRLDAEMIRDQALAVSGLLNPQLYGPPVNPPIPDGVWKPFAASDKWNTPKPGDPNRYRRSIYTYTKRSIPYPMFAAFDAPSREFCTPRRLRSNTPLQALMTLNDETFVECSDALAKRMHAASETVSEQIAFGFRLVTCRQPRPDELEDLVLLYRYNTAGSEQPDQRKETTTGPEDSSATHEEAPATHKEAPQMAGLRRVAAVLLNLDEFLTK